MSNTGIPEYFGDLGQFLTVSLKNQWQSRLLNNKVDYKKSILLSLRKLYPNIKDAENAGFSHSMLKHAVNILRQYGYYVDLKNSLIVKKTQ